MVANVICHFSVSLTNNLSLALFEGVSQRKLAFDSLIFVAFSDHFGSKI